MVAGSWLRKSRLVVLVVVVLSLLGPAKGQFRNEQDPEYYRYREENNRGWKPYTTPPPSLGSYRSGGDKITTYLPIVFVHYK